MYITLTMRKEIEKAEEKQAMHEKSITKLFIIFTHNKKNNSVFPVNHDHLLPVKLFGRLDLSFVLCY
jgi:hypothetical protein